MIEIKQECHCENPALEKAKEKGYELVCPDCWRWRKPLTPECPLEVQVYISGIQI